METLDGARKLDEEQLCAFRRPVGRIDFALEPVECDVRARAPGDVPDQWPADAGAIAPGHETRIARKRCESDSPETTVGICQLRDGAAGRRVQGNELELKTPRSCADGHHRDRAVVREDRAEQKPSAAVDSLRRTEGAVRVDLDHVQMIAPLIGGDETEPIADAGDG